MSLKRLLVQVQKRRKGEKEWSRMMLGPKRGVLHAGGKRLRDQTRCVTEWGCGIPFKTQMMATAVMTMTSLPSKKKASHNRSWVWNGKVFANKVMYHLVAYDVEEIMCLVLSPYECVSSRSGASSMKTYK